MSEELDLQASAGDWDEDFKDKSEEQKSEGFTKAKFMEMADPGTYRIRLVGSHVKFRKHWNPFRATVHFDGKADDPAWQAGFVPGKRFAINVIDKTGVADGEVGELKILEKGAQVFKNFSAYKTATGKDPAGKQGPDFIVTVTVPMKDGKPNRMKTEYSVIPVDAAPFTDAEKEMLRETGLYSLKDIYKPATAEKLQELWDELPADKKIAPPKPWDKDNEKKDSPKKGSSPAPKETIEPEDDQFADSGDNDGDENGTELF